MRFRSFWRIQVRQLILRWQWALPFLSFAFLSYLASNGVANGAGSLHSGVTGNATNLTNAWDALFVTYGNGLYMAFVIVNLFLLITCDRLPEPPFGRLATFRLGSRRKYWLGKSFSMLFAAFVYTLVGFLLILIIASGKLGFSWDWSQFGKYGSNILVPDQIILSSTPFKAALTIFFLNVIGLWALGTLMQVVALLTKRYLFGYGLTLLLLIASLGLSLIEVQSVGDTLIKLIPVIHNLSMNFYPFPYRDVPIIWSYVYWALWLIVLLPSGFALSRRQDF